MLAARPVTVARVMRQIATELILYAELLLAAVLMVVAILGLVVVIYSVLALVMPT